MKSPRPLTPIKLAALAALSLLLLSPDAHAQDPKPAQTPPGIGLGIGPGEPGPVTDKGPDSDGPFPAREVETKAVITSKPEPGYTDEALANDVYGVVRLRAVLSSKGEVSEVVVYKGLPDGLTEAALDAARRISFTPARRYGHTVSQYVTLEYYFSLDDEDADRKVSILEQPRPAYTEEARRNGVAGKVVIGARFRRDGTVSSPSVIERLPHGLTESALEALSRIRFAPAEFKGRKVTVYRRVVFVFPPGAPAKQ